MTKTYQPYDKIFRKVLFSKIHATELINQYFLLKNKLKEEDIERYTCKFVNLQFQNRESDILYKMKNTNIFFLIEHQSRIDYNMAQRIAEYQIEIIKLENPKTENRKNIIVPLIIPIVIYTNNKTKWDAAQSIEAMQPQFNSYPNQKIGQYNILDINTFDTQKLLHNNLFTLRILGLEKAKNKEELDNIFQYILYTEKNEQNVRILKEIAYYVYDTVLENEKVKKKFEEWEEGEKNMSFIDILLEEKQSWKDEARREGLEEGKQEGIKEGIKEGIEEGKKKKTYEIIMKMLKKQFSENMIIELTNIKPEELNELKKSCRNR